MQPCCGKEVVRCRNGVNNRRSENERDHTEPETALGERREAVSAHQPAQTEQEEHERAPARPREMRLPPVVQHTSEIPPDDGRECWRQQKHIGDLFRLCNREEYEDENPPHLKERKLLRLLAKTVAEGILDRLDEDARPWEEAEDEDGQVEPPMRTHGMQRCRKSADVVEPDELVDERHAVHLVHIEIPWQPHGNDKEKSPQNVHAKELLKLTRREQIEENDPRRKNDPNRSLCHHSNPAGEVHQPVLPMNEGEECCRHKEEQRRVRHGRLPHIHEDDARPHDKSRPEPRTRTKEARPGECRHEDGADRHERRGKACCKLVEAPEYLERSHNKPIKNRRLVIPELIVNAGRKIIAEANHLLCRLRIDRFVWVKQRRPADSKEDLK